MFGILKNKLNFSPNPKYTHLFSLFIIGAVTILIYGQSIQFPFLWDDFFIVLKNKDVSSGNLWGIFTHSLGQWGGFHSNAYRPIQILSYYANYLISQFHPASYHLTNIILHFLTACLLYVFILIISRRVLLSLAVSLIFAVHPLGVESVAYVSGRSDILVAFFGYCYFIFYLLSQKQGSIIKRYALYVLGLVSYALAVFSKESAISYPFILIICEYLFFSSSLKQILKHIFSCLIVVFIYLLAKFFVTTSHVPAGPPIAILERFILLPYILLDYLQILLLPHPNNTHMEYLSHAYFNQINFHQLIFKILLMSAIIYLLYRGRVKINSLIIFGFLWFLVSLVPFLNLIQKLNAPLAVHWLYWPGSGFFLAVIVLSEQFIKNKVRTDVAVKLISSAVFGVFICYLILQSVDYTKKWGNEIDLYTYTLKHAPDSVRAANNLSVALRKNGDYIEAYELLKELKSKYPNNRIINNNINLVKKLAKTKSTA